VGASRESGMYQPTVVVGALRNHATFSPNEKLSKPLPSALFLHLDKDFYPLEMQKIQKREYTRPVRAR
jgi:hypothetical protein